MNRLPIISKSAFLRGKQCLKSLYLSKKHPELKDELTQEQQAIFASGTTVGELAQQLFPSGVLAARNMPDGFKESLEQTQQLITQGAEIIYEAELMFNNMTCFVDILAKENGRWHIYEVKSSTSVKDVNLLDAAFQYYVLISLGMDVADVSIVLINNQYVRQGELDIHQLFRSESVFEQVKALLPEVADALAIQTDALQQSAAPKVDIGQHCSTPYTCDFKGYCWKDIPDYSVFNISRLSGSIKFELAENGILLTTDLPCDYPLSESQTLQVHADKTGETVIDRQQIQNFLNPFRYPLYFLDFETFNPAVPLYDFSRPYQQIVFQYSLHILEKPGAELIHKEFLAGTDTDPRPKMMEQLIRDIKTEGSIIAYNKGFEVGRLKEIAGDFPRYETAFDNITQRVVDLMYPFQQKHYYTPAMKGSYSIKHVLPALVPGFGYDSLAISNGTDASLAFEKLLYEKDPALISQIRRNLLEYCRMDTLAMVEILKALEKL